MEHHNKAATALNGKLPKQVDELADRINKEVRAVGDRVAEWNEQFVALVRSRPLTALVVAGAVGFLVGRIVRA